MIHPVGRLCFTAWAISGRENDTKDIFIGARENETEKGERVCERERV